MKTKLFNVEGMERRAVFSEPGTGHPKAAVLFFHGHLGTAEAAAKARRIALAWPEALLVYAQGLDNPDTKRGFGWQRDFGMDGDRDLLFVYELLEHLGNEYEIGERETFACGLSNGGSFSLLLSAGMPDRFSAFASVAGAGGRFLLRLPATKPVLMINGRNDDIMPYWAAEKTMRHLVAISKASAEECHESLQCWSVGGKSRFFELRTYEGAHLWPKMADGEIAAFLKRHLEGP